MSNNTGHDPKSKRNHAFAANPMDPILQHNQYSGMTPSIITTINNTSPTPPVDVANLNSINSNNNTIQKNKRTTEPVYESYIEDSFVGHWEREDDDDDIEGTQYGSGNNTGNPNADNEDESTLHPSTIEFDFDSFGPESFIYTPSSIINTTAQTSTSAASLIIATQNDAHSEPSRSHDQQQQETTTTYDTNHEPFKQDVTPLGNPHIDSNLVDGAQIDLKVIEPYKKVISHAGYCHHLDTSIDPPLPGETAPAVIVFSACYLPDRSRRDYNYVMDHLFLYVLNSLHDLIADDYILIYLHNTQSSSLSSGSSARPTANTTGQSSTTDEPQHKNNLPTFSWMKRCYQMIDRKLRKNLKILYLVKPTFWLKTVVIMCKPFISAKFSKKLRFIEDLDGLRKCLPIDKLTLPASANNL